MCLPHFSPIGWETQVSQMTAEAPATNHSFMSDADTWAELFKMFFYSKELIILT